MALIGAGVEAHACAGRFVVESGDGTLLGDPAIAVDATTVTLGDGCGPAPARVLRTGRRGWRIRARWASCGGARRLVLRGRVSADCTLVTGTVRGRGLRRTTFTATPSRCGDGVVDAGGGERCDDGNTLGGDPCEPTCVPCDPSTGPLRDSWAGIEENLFARYGCPICHGISAISGGLDLRPDVALANLVGVPSGILPELPLVRPGDERASVLWLKLAKGVYGGFDDVPNGGMPLGDRITPAELDAVAAWIRGGAPAAGVVPGSELLLERCRAR